jgi:three-Cys-motif partner protein
VTRSADHFDEFEAHTQLKHLVLGTYLAAWARKLLLRKGAGDTVYYIDACAGRGMDDAGHHGSPVLAAREAEVIERQLREEFGRDVHVVVIAIEKNAMHFKALERNLAPFGNRARALRGTAEELLPSGLSRSRQTSFIERLSVRKPKCFYCLRTRRRCATTA